jgi:hypothetical protein
LQGSRVNEHPAEPLLLSATAEAGFELVGEAPGAPKARVGVIEREMSVGVEAVRSVLADAASYPRWLLHLTEIRRIDGMNWIYGSVALAAIALVFWDAFVRRRTTRSGAALESCGDDRLDCDGDRSRRGRVRCLATGRSRRRLRVVRPC